jgi:hypothetical protein
LGKEAPNKKEGAGTQELDTCVQSRNPNSEKILFSDTKNYYSKRSRHQHPQHPPHSTAPPPHSAFAFVNKRVVFLGKILGKRGKVRSLFLRSPEGLNL